MFMYDKVSLDIYIFDDRLSIQSFSGYLFIPFSFQILFKSIKLIYLIVHVFTKKHAHFNHGCLFIGNFVGVCSLNISSTYI